VKPAFIDLSSDACFGLRSMEAALATARATEKRAEFLLALSKASPELLAKAQGIYVRAGVRAKKIQARLDQLVGTNHEFKS
jgi:tRNA 2-selenouridine synthase SelU